MDFYVSFRDVVQFFILVWAATNKWDVKRTKHFRLRFLFLKNYKVAHTKHKAGESD